MTQVTCLDCKQPLSAEELLGGCGNWDASVDCVQFKCPRCSKPSELRLESGRLTYGYVYAAGSPHFSAQLPVTLSTLFVEQTPEGLRVTLDDVTRTLPRG
jgi:hypothetical protein